MQKMEVSLEIKEIKKRNFSLFLINTGLLTIFIFLYWRIFSIIIPLFPYDAARHSYEAVAFTNEFS